MPERSDPRRWDGLPTAVLLREVDEILGVLYLRLREMTDAELGCFRDLGQDMALDAGREMYRRGLPVEAGPTGPCLPAMGERREG